MSYRRITAATLASRLGKTGPDTIKKWKNGIPDANRDIILDSLARALDLPREWFTADLNRVSQLPADPLFQPLSQPCPAATRPTGPRATPGDLMPDLPRREAPGTRSEGA